MNKKPKNSNIVYNDFNFNKFNISDEGFNGLSDDTKYKHLKKHFLEK